MSPFRCASGHQVQLAFGDEHLRLPCPKCGIEVYKFRDAVIEEDAPAAPDGGEHGGRDKVPALIRAKHLGVAIGGVVFLLAVALFAWHRTASPAATVSRGPVLPIGVPPGAAPVPPAEVSITNFRATPSGSGVVRVCFRLTNAGAASMDYPGLAVRWHGAPDADQRIGKDSYAHPPLPFTATDVTLELARPRGATGIDVKLTY